MIVGGARIVDYDRIRSLRRPTDYFIYCDSGLSHKQRLKAEPNLIVGDFDSYKRPLTDTEIIALPREKDDTDTVYAAKEAVRRGFEEFLLVGMIGGRFDHSLGNLGLLLMLDGLRKKAVLADDLSLMEIVSGKGCEVFGGCLFFSLFAVDGPADGVTITGAKYEVSEQSFRMENACLGVSNEVRDGETARIRVRTGRLLLVSVFRE